MKKKFAIFEKGTVDKNTFFRIIENYNDVYRLIKGSTYLRISLKSYASKEELIKDYLLQYGIKPCTCNVHRRLSTEDKKVLAVRACAEVPDFAKVMWEQLQKKNKYKICQVTE
jgi:hypothetical protein